MAFFSYTPAQFFQKLVRAYDAFSRQPSEDGLMDVVLVLYHLREWLNPTENVGQEMAEIKAKAPGQRTDEEALFLAVGELSEFRIVRGLCNHAKHFELSKPIDHRMQIVPRFRTGLSRAGDSLGVINFTVGGVEVRSVIQPVYTKYFDYFQAKQPGLVKEALKR